MRNFYTNYTILREVVENQCDEEALRCLTQMAAAYSNLENENQVMSDVIDHIDKALNERGI